jgi:pilus assembly protein CpaB
MNLQNIQRKFPLIIAIACGILAVVMLNIYLKQKEDNVWLKMKEVIKQQQSAGGGGQAPVEKMSVVLVAKRNIMPQTLIVAEDIMIKQVPEGAIQPGAVSSIDKVIGKIVLSPVLEKEQVLSSKLVEAGKIGKSLAEITPKGRRAMTINIDRNSTINGFLRPGDFVDVLVALNTKAEPEDQNSIKEQFTIPFLQGIEILAIGTDYLTRSDLPGGDSKESAADRITKTINAGTVTLALTLQETLLVSYVQDHGSIKLVLHSKDDKQGVIASSVNEEFLLRYLHPEVMEDWRPTTPTSTIEVYRGLNKQFMPLSKEKK